MFYITSKDKIISVIIALSTVIVLFLLASSLKVKNTPPTACAAEGAGKN